MTMKGRPEVAPWSGAGERAGGRFRFGVMELGGALGDLGTLLPLAIALITLNGMSATSIFLVVGLVYVLAGAYYRLPVPVQPLKAVAAIAIAEGLSASVVSAAGILMACFLLALAASGAVSTISKLFPRPVIRGIQFGVALLLIKAGISLISRRQVVVGGEDAVIALDSLAIPLGWLLAFAFGLLSLVLLKRKAVPASLVLIGLGIGVGMFWGTYAGLGSLRLGLNLPTLAVPNISDLSAALFLLVIPQIPLTLGNAVFATADTARTYFGPRADRVTHRALLTTMGAGNLGAGLLGGVPVCHGSGGVTAHYRLGARTGGAVIMIGALMIVLAVLGDGSAVPILSLIPYSVLGILVLMVGLQHAMLAREVSGAGETGVVILIGVVALLTSNLAVGFGLGILLHRTMGLINGRRLESPKIAPHTALDNLLSGG